MKIPKYVDELLGFNGKYGRVKTIEQITDYQKYPNSIGGYLYQINMQKYQWSRCFESKINRFVAWCRREYAEVIIHEIHVNGWNTYAILSITDPVALALEKNGLI